MKNIPIISRILIAMLDEANMAILDATDEIAFDDIPGSATMVKIPHTPLSASFSEKMTPTDAGEQYTKEISFKIPQILKKMESDLKPFIKKPLMALISDPNGTHQLVYPLNLTYDRQNPGTASGNRGIDGKLTGNYHFSSIFVKTMPETDEFEEIGSL